MFRSPQRDVPTAIAIFPTTEYRASRGCIFKMQALFQIRSTSAITDWACP
jgi:hypothetical protein